MIVDYLIILLSNVWNFHQNQIFLKHLIEKWYGKTRVTSYELQVTSYELRVESLKAEVEI